MYHRRSLLPVLFLGAVSLIVSPMLGQVKNGKIEGRVTDSTGSVLQGAQVELQPGGVTGVSDSRGTFSLTDLEPGTYAVTVSYVGFSRYTSKVGVSAGQTTEVEAALTVASSCQEVTVTAAPENAVAEAVNIERSADNILQVLPAAVITSLPNATIANAAGRLPGVSLERDRGENKYIDVRGTAPELTNTTIDGVNTPSPEGGVRQVKLDTIPADLVAAVVVIINNAADRATVEFEGAPARLLDGTSLADRLGGCPPLQVHNGRLSGDLPGRTASIYVQGGN